MNKELQERIEKLKDPKQAQPFWMRTKEDQDILVKAETKNQLVTNPQKFPAWYEPTDVVKAWPDEVRILKPDYKPEQEYIEIEIEVVNKGVWLEDAAPGWTGDCSICKASMHKDFVCFHYIDGSETVVPGNVPNWLRLNPGQTMYTRFVRSI